MGSYYRYQPQMASTMLAAGQMVTGAADSVARSMMQAAQIQARVAMQEAQSTSEMYATMANLRINAALTRAKLNHIGGSSRGGGSGSGSSIGRHSAPWHRTTPRPENYVDSHDGGMPAWRRRMPIRNEAVRHGYPIPGAATSVDGRLKDSFRPSPGAGTPTTTTTHTPKAAEPAPDAGAPTTTPAPKAAEPAPDAWTVEQQFNAESEKQAYRTNSLYMGTHVKQDDGSVVTKIVYSPYYVSQPSTEMLKTREEYIKTFDRFAKNRGLDPAASARAFSGIINSPESMRKLREDAERRTAHVIAGLSANLRQAGTTVMVDAGVDYNTGRRKYKTVLVDNRFSSTDSSKAAIAQLREGYETYSALQNAPVTYEDAAVLGLYSTSQIALDATVNREKALADARKALLQDRVTFGAEVFSDTLDMSPINTQLDTPPEDSAAPGTLEASAAPGTSDTSKEESTDE